MTRIEKGNTQRIGLDSPIQLVRDVPTIFDTNSLVETGFPMDMAINGEGFFNIQSDIPAEEDNGGPQVEGGSGPILLTRSFALDEEGYLILPGVGKVLGQEGPIQVDGSNFVVDGEGKVFNSDGTQVGILQITEPSEDAELDKTSNGLYTIAKPTIPPRRASRLSRGSWSGTTLTSTRSTPWRCRHRGRSRRAARR